MSKWAKTNEPCPDQVDCKSSDAYSEDLNGQGFCFSCKKFYKNDVEVELTDDDSDYEYLSVRGLTPATIKHYQMTTKVTLGLKEATRLPYPSGCIKFRSHLLPKKVKGSMWLSGGGGIPELFGQDKFAKGSKASITITQGEYDAASVYQMLNGVTAAVSVKHGDSSVIRDFAANQEYINSFDRIYLCFDSDKPGQEQIAEAAKFFDFRKVYVVSMSRKDANAYINGTDGDIDPDTFIREWRGAKKYTPDSILSSFSEFEEALDEDPSEMISEFPFEGFNTALHGIFAGQLIVIKAPEGVGKTELFRAMEYHALKEEKKPIGLVHMEESNAVTLRGIATYELGQPANDDTVCINNHEVMDAVKAACDNDADRIMLHSSNDVEDEERFLDSLRYMLAVGKCRIIFFDHITWLATGNMEDDERKLLDKISQEIKKLAIIHNAAIVMISHINDDGKTRGSRNITKVADVVINLYRNKEAADVKERNTLHFVAEKSRKQGTTTGPLGSATYDRYTGKLEENVFKGEPDEYI